MESYESASPNAN